MESKKHVSSPVVDSARRQQKECAMAGRGDHDAKKYEGLFERVKSCHTIQEVLSTYHSEPFQRSLERIEWAQKDKLSEDDLGAWAKDWAMDRGNVNNSEHYHAALQLDNDRRVCLELLKVICDNWRAKNGTELPIETSAPVVGGQETPPPRRFRTISREDIVNEFGSHKIRRILCCCLVMDRAQALFKMRQATHPIGMHWYAQQHLELDQCKAFPERNDPTLSRKYVYLLEMEELGLRGGPRNELLDRWSQPQAAPEA